VLLFGRTAAGDINDLSEARHKQGDISAPISTGILAVVAFWAFYFRVKERWRVFSWLLVHKSC
jgi:hypothetical protein